MQRFGTKRGLLLALAAQGPRWVEKQLVETAEAARAAAGHCSPLAALVDALTRVPAQLADPRAMANHLAFLQLDLSDPEFGAYAVAQAQAFRQGIHSLLELAVSCGELRAADTSALARALQVTYNGVLVTWAVEPDVPLSLRLEAELAPRAWSVVHRARARSPSEVVRPPATRVLVQCDLVLGRDAQVSLHPGWVAVAEQRDRTREQPLAAAVSVAGGPRCQVLEVYQAVGRGRTRTRWPARGPERQARVGSGSQCGAGAQRSHQASSLGMKARVLWHRLRILCSRAPGRPRFFVTRVGSR